MASNFWGFDPETGLTRLFMANEALPPGWTDLGDTPQPEPTELPTTINIPPSWRPPIGYPTPAEREKAKTVQALMIGGVVLLGFFLLTR